MISKVPVTLLASAVLAFACGPRARSEAMREEPVRSVRTSSAQPLETTLDVMTGSDGVRFAFAVTNHSKKKLEVTFPDGRTHDVIVLDSLGREIWRWSEGRLFTQAMQARVLRTSEALRYEGAWDAPAPGRYVAVATLESRNFPVREQVEFVIR